MIIFVAMIGGLALPSLSPVGSQVHAQAKYNPSKDAVMSVSVFKRMGRVYYHKRVFTYYSPNGSHVYGMGAYTSDGTYTLNGRDKNGYLILANNKKIWNKNQNTTGCRGRA
ncbi:hypothetical protein [Secundilactobacillus collinoides]|uniref:hypothetical protein n=1 Tax=Secundilactobacillus collinoides TaxID=33960 RepID=UPI000AC0E42E|nr:hypothetical protein [Secundilactobacillus collinoides]